MEPDKIIHIQPQKAMRSDALRNRQHLLEAAQRLFDKHDVADVTMSAIAKEAQVGKGTLYRNFPDKAALCHALLDSDIRAFQQQTLDKLNKSTDPHETLRWFLEAAVTYTVDHSEMLHEVANHIGTDMLCHPAHLWWRQTLAKLLTEAQTGGDLDYLTDVFYVMLDVQAIRFQRREQGYSLERIIDGLNMMLDRLIRPMP